MNTNSVAEGIRQLHKGQAGQLKVAGLFQGWHWQTARPEPDLGGDLIVSACDVPGEGGPSFITQIKSSNKTPSSITLKHRSAARLRDHVLPAFLFFLNLRSREIAWVYLEPLFFSDASFKSGGALRVRLPKKSWLRLDSSDPPAELTSCIKAAKSRSALKAQPSLAGYARELRSAFREIDPRFEVNTTFDGQNERHELRASGAPVELNFTLHPRSETNSTLKDCAHRRN